MQAAVLVAPKSFNPRGNYVMYAGEYRASVFVQDGHMFGENGDDLVYTYNTDPDKARHRNVLYWMNYNGYAINAELRSEVLKMRRKAELEQRIAEEMERLDQAHKRELEELEKELQEARRRDRQRNLGPIPPDPSDRVIPELELSETEEQILSSLEQDYAMPPLSDDEDFQDPDYEAATAHELPPSAPAPATVRRGKAVRR